MPRVKRGVTARARHKKVLAQAKGYRGRRSSVYRIAKEAVMKAGQYQYRDRRQKKREFRALWIARINAAARELGLSYSAFMNGPEEGVDRHRPQGAGRSRRPRQSGFWQDRGAGRRPPSPDRSAQTTGRRNPPPLFLFGVRAVIIGRRDFQWATICASPIITALTPMDDLNRIVDSALADFAACADPAGLENAKAKYLGKAGTLTTRLKGLGQLPPAERAAAGAGINAAKARLEDALAARREALAEAKLAAQLGADALDVSLPGRGRGNGGLHPLTRTLERIETLFRSIGFDVADGPEIEDDFHNFTALNISGKPSVRARCTTPSTSTDGMVLRTHTSPMQIRYMETHAPPIRIIAPGRVYRVDSDATHSPMFHQVEGLWIDDDVILRRPEGRVHASSCALSSSATT